MDNTIIEKIHKLLSMAEHPNSNEHEAAIALEKAQELLLRHNLTRADVKNDNGSTSPVGIGKIDRTELNGYTWKRQLINTLAKANLCKVIGSPSDKAWHLFGSYDNVRSVLEMYEWVKPQLEWLANKGFRAYKNDEGTERGQTWKASFYYGATIAIGNRLTKPLEDFTQGPGHALVIANTALVKEAIKRVFPHLTSGRRVLHTGSSGMAAGHQAGSNMHLTPQRKLTGTLLLS